MSSDERSAIERTAVELNSPLDEAAVSRLVQYLALLRKWNRLHNLTALREPQRMLTHHLFDSLSVLPGLQRELTACSGSSRERIRLLDVGSGAGLPGVIIAICRPQWEVDCIDAVAKKAAFIRQVAAELSLPNLAARQGRVEVLQIPKADRPFDVIAARAFSSLDKLVACSGHLLASDGVWLAMKGKTPSEEIAALPASIEMFHVEQLKVPELDEQRCIVWMRKKAV